MSIVKIDHYFEVNFDVVHRTINAVKRKAGTGRKPVLLMHGERSLSIPTKNTIQAVYRKSHVIKGGHQTLWTYIQVLTKFRPAGVRRSCLYSFYINSDGFCDARARLDGA